jgi:hypothetical protein
VFFRNVCRFSTESDLIYKMLTKMEAICSSEVSVHFKRTTGCYIPDYRCENLKSRSLRYPVYKNQLLAV